MEPRLIASTRRRCKGDEWTEELRGYSPSSLLGDRRSAVNSQRFLLHICALLINVFTTK